MASLNYTPSSFVNGTAADANDINAVLAQIKSFVETETVQKDGSVKAGTSSLSTALMNLLTPVGSITAYAGSTAPTGWLICDGTTIPSQHTALIALVGASTPDLRGHTLVGKSASAPFNGALLTKFGSTTSTAPHSHSIDHDHAPFTSGDDSPDHAHGYLMPAYGTNPIQNAADTSLQYSFVGSPNNTGGATSRHAHSIDVPYFSGGSGPSSAGTAHGNVQPSALVTYIIKHD